MLIDLPADWRAVGEAVLLRLLIHMALGGGLRPERLHPWHGYRRQAPQIIEFPTVGEAQAKPSLRWETSSTGRQTAG